MINNILKNIPEPALGQIRFVDFYFFGHAKNLDSLKKLISLDMLEVSVHPIQDGIKVSDFCQIDERKLKKKDTYYKKLAKNADVEYDGFEILLDSTEKSIISEFSEKFSAGDFFYWKNSKDNFYLVGQYIAGKYSAEGCLFNIINENFNDLETFDHNKKYDFIYDQPVFLKIDPLLVSFLSHEKNKDLSSLSKYRFRCEIGEFSAGFIEEFYKTNPTNNDVDFKNLITILYDLYKKNVSIPIKKWLIIEYTVQNGEVKKIEYLNATDENISIYPSYCFGIFGDLEMASSRLLKENFDIVFLSNRILRT